MIRIRISGEDGGAVRGSGYIELSGGGERSFDIPRNGRVSIDIAPGLARAAYIWPVNGYAQCKLDNLSGYQEIVCPRFNAHFRSGWREALGIESRDTDGAGVRVAVVDMGFERDPTLGHLRLSDSAGRIISADEAAAIAPGNRHGLDVARIISGRGTPAQTGIAPGATTQLFCVEPDTEFSAGSAASVFEAVLSAVEEFGADIINLSMGVSKAQLEKAGCVLSEIRDHWRLLIRKAESRGCVIIAAAGNSTRHGVLVPASLQQTIGVGGIGFCDVLGPPSFCASLQSLAEKELAAASTFGKDSYGIQYFADVTLSNGLGINCCAPANGFMMQDGKGDAIEFCGTSFAAPVVTGMLAVMLSEHRKLNGRQTWSDTGQLRALFKKTLQDLGIDKRYQGQGLVSLRPVGRGKLAGHAR